MSLAVVKRTVWPRSVAWCARLRRIMVLPTPLGPSRTALMPSSTNLSVNSSSTASRSTRLGQRCVQQIAKRKLRLGRLGALGLVAVDTPLQQLILVRQIRHGLAKRSASGLLSRAT
jgi:hypothetical protein